MTPLSLKVKGYFRVRGFKFFERHGLHIVPNHFYEPVPDTRFLPEETWTQPSSLPGINMNEPGQLELLATLSQQFSGEFGDVLIGAQFGPVDAEMLYAIVRQWKPRQILEVGSGTTTQISASAIVRNGSGKLVAIEPYPNQTLQAGFPGLTRLIASPVQDVEMAEFESLAENDILFIDSSHMLKLGSDVQLLFLEILPRLKAGVIVHIHDIFLPYSYPRSWVVDGVRFWNEQYLLQAFLIYNKAFEVLWAGNYMHMRNPDKLESAFPSYERGGHRPPGSFWIRKTC